MPRINKRNCDWCCLYYEGRGEKFCGKYCQDTAAKMHPSMDSVYPAGHLRTIQVPTADIETPGRVSSLEDLKDLFDVDEEQYEIRNFHVNSREKHTVSDGYTTLHTVRANLVPRYNEGAESALQQIADDFYADITNHAPSYRPVKRPKYLSDESDPVLFELAVFDPHIGMLAWGEEVGEDYDTKIAATDYAQAVSALLPMARLYPTEKILFIAGNDFLHVDSVGNNSSGGTTTKGTNQDIDTRLAKMFTAGRRILVSAIDQARLVAPVDVLVVPGNHDREQMYRMGEVLSAWYRNDPEVTIIFGPNKRKFYPYGGNAFMFSHGEEKRTELPLIFATECDPARMFADATYREIQVGHLHRLMEGKYYPTSEASEDRAIRVRSLPGLTATDSWHHATGYKHQRAATALAFRKSGGPVGVHEFDL